MAEEKRYPVDIGLWRRRRQASKEDRWKWSFDLWDPIIEKIIYAENGEIIQELNCPVCGSSDLYAYFIVRDLNVTSRDEGRLIFSSERWFGCHSCQTQVRDLGILPSWVDFGDIVWGTETVREGVLKEIHAWGLGRLLPNK